MVRGLAVTLAALALALLLSPSAQASPNPHNSLDCLFCHDDTPRFGVDTRETVGFYRFESDDPSLCYVCHKPEENLHPIGVTPGAEALATKAPTHLPLAVSEGLEGKVVCTTCHFIHAADASFALLRGSPGSQQPRLFLQRQGFCRQCHGEKLENRSPHAADERACAFCHAVRPTGEGGGGLMPQGIALCNFCHGALQQDHTRGLIAFEGRSDCMNCHDPHLSAESPARLRAEYFDLIRGTVTVNPHYRRVLCSLCHVEEKKFTLITRDTTLLCNRCHASRKIVGGSHPLSRIPPGMELPEDWPVREGNLVCLTCHFPGHQDDPRGDMLLRGGAYESRAAFCDRCHDPEDRGATNPHPMIRELKGCTGCHAEIPVFGKDNAQTVTFNASINVTCLTCHDPPPHPGGRSHTIGVDPERAAGIPSYFPLSPPGRITCATCHNPHLAGNEDHKLRETLTQMAICTACHF